MFLRVRAHGRQGHAELARDVRAVEVALQQAQDLELALAERLDQGLVARARPSGVTDGGQEPADIARGVRLLRGQLQQRRHRRPLVDEDADVALRLGQVERARQRRERRRRVADGVVGERLDDQDVDDAARPPPVLGRGQQAIQELERLADRCASARSRDPWARRSLARVTCSNSRR